MGKPTDGSDDFDVTGSGEAAPAASAVGVVSVAQPPVPSEPAAVAKPAPKPDEDDEADPKPAVQKEPPPVVLSAADFLATFKAQQRAAAEHHLNQLALAHPEVQALIDRVAELEKEIAKLRPAPKKAK